MSRDEREWRVRAARVPCVWSERSCRSRGRGAAPGSWLIFIGPRASMCTCAPLLSRVCPLPTHLPALPSLRSPGGALPPSTLVLTRLRADRPSLCISRSSMRAAARHARGSGESGSLPSPSYPRSRRVPRAAWQQVARASYRLHPSGPHVFSFANVAMFDLRFGLLPPPPLPPPPPFLLLLLLPPRVFAPLALALVALAA